MWRSQNKNCSHLVLDSWHFPFSPRQSSDVVFSLLFSCKLFVTQLIPVGHLIPSTLVDSTSLYLVSVQHPDLSHLDRCYVLPFVHRETHSGPISSSTLGMASRSHTLIWAGQMMESNTSTELLGFTEWQRMLKTARDLTAAHCFYTSLVCEWKISSLIPAAVHIAWNSSLPRIVMFPLYGIPFLSFITSGSLLSMHIVKLQICTFWS